MTTRENPVRPHGDLLKHVESETERKVLGAAAGCGADGAVT